MDGTSLDHRRAPPQLTSSVAAKKPKPTPGKIPGKLVKQAHGGALMQGGSNPNSGRPAAQLRGSMREILHGSIDHLRNFAMGTSEPVVIVCPECNHPVYASKPPMPADQLRAIEITAKYGLPKEGYDAQMIDSLWTIVEEALYGPTQDPTALATIIKRGWVPILAEKVMSSQ